jgi:hypothetical protein
MQTEQNIKGIAIPKTYEEAISGPNAKEWKAAMDKEINENSARGVYTLVSTPKGTRILGGKWVFTLKLDEFGEISRFKARWVVQGFRQRKGIEYTKTYAPVVAGSTVRTLFAVAAVRGWHVKQIDFITAVTELTDIVTELAPVLAPTNWRSTINQPINGPTR